VEIGWRAHFEPETHPVVFNYEFNVLIGADGRRNSLQGFQHKEFRGKLAIGITCNYVNHHTREEQNFEGIISLPLKFLFPFLCSFRNQWCRKDL
jgi:hypothetical protein